MNYYLEITLINDKEFGFSRLWTAVYTQLHLAFVEQKDANEQIPYGISFPEYKAFESKGKKVMLLGSKLRVFANSQQELQALGLDKWLGRLADYVHIKSCKEVETVSQYLTVNRYRPQASPENLARRYASRHSVSVDDALNRLDGYEQNMEPYPYIQMKSLSGGREFSLCINQRVAEKVYQGKFSCYGLSATSTVPHW